MYPWTPPGLDRWKQQDNQREFCDYSAKRSYAKELGQLLLPISSVAAQPSAVTEQSATLRQRLEHLRSMLEQSNRLTFSDEDIVLARVVVDQILTSLEEMRLKQKNPPELTLDDDRTVKKLYKTVDTAPVEASYVDVFVGS